MKKILFSYLRFWANRFIKRAVPEIIAVTGSVGKTSAKDAIFEVLKIRFNGDVEKSHGNLNNETGVPLAVLGYKTSPANFFSWILILVSAPIKSMVRKKYRYLVLELAADKPGDIKYLTSFIHPKISVLTGIGPAHMAAFGSLQNIIEEKVELLRVLPRDGTAVLNIEDENVKKISYGGRWQKITYAISQDADITASNIKTGIRNFQSGTTFSAKFGKEIFKIQNRTLGKEANVLAALAGIAVGKLYKLSGSDIERGLGNFKSGKHRMNVVEGKNGIIIIDDSYNANPQSMESALNVLKDLKTPGKKYAVLGDMREIGKISSEAHILIGKYAQEVADLFIGVGILAKKYNSKIYFRNPKKAADFLLSKVEPNDIILIKASRVVGLEKIVDILKG